MSTTDVQVSIFDTLPVLLAAVAATGCGTIALVAVTRLVRQMDRDSTRATYSLDFPADLTIDQVTAFIRSLTSLKSRRHWLLGYDSVVFETVQCAGSIQHRLRSGKVRANQVMTHLTAALPGVRVAELVPPLHVQADYASELQLGSALPIRTDVAVSFAANLHHTLGAAGDNATEQVVYQVVVSPLGATTLPTRRRTGAPGNGRWLHRAIRVFSPGPTVVVTPAELREKSQEPLFGIALRVGATAARRGRSRRLVNRVSSLIHQLDRPGATFAWRWIPQPLATRRVARAATPFSGAPIYANARELATLLAWPLGGPTAPGLHLNGGRDFPPDAQLPTTGRVYGQSTYPGQERPVAVTPADSRMHTLILGPTGSGKSTELLGLIAQDLAAGRGLVLVDPNVSLAEAAIDLVPPHRVDDLIYLNPASDRPVALNPLDCAPEDAELVADQMLELIRDQSISWGVGLEELLRNALVLLAATPGMTLAEVPTVLRDDGFRDVLLSRLIPALQPTVGEFFASFTARTLPQRVQDTAAVLNKVSPLLDRRPLRLMLGQDRTTWSMQQVLDRRKILIVALPAGSIGPLAANLVGSMVVRMVWNATLGRATAPTANHPALSLYLDELPRFVGPGTDLADMLARARALGLDLVGAFQHLSQVPPKLQAALLSEARNKVVFQPAADDAGLLARHLLGVRPEDLLSLRPRTAIASLVANSHVAAPVSIATLPPLQPTGFGPAARAASEQRYGRDRTDIEAEILARRLIGHGDGPRRTRRAA